MVFELAGRFDLHKRINLNLTYHDGQLGSVGQSLSEVSQPVLVHNSLVDLGGRPDVVYELVVVFAVCDLHFALTGAKSATVVPIGSITAAGKLLLDSTLVVRHKAILKLTRLFDVSSTTVSHDFRFLST